MSEIQRIKVINPKDNWCGTECYINDKKIDFVKSIDFRVAFDEVPTFVLETIGFPDIDMSGNIRFDFTPQTVDEAIKVLRNDLLKHGDLYKGFLASIKSALDDYGHVSCHFEEKNAEVACEILKRIVGED